MLLPVVFFDLDNTLTNRTATIGAYVDKFANDFTQLLKPCLDKRELANRFNTLDCGGYARLEKRGAEIVGLDIWVSAPCVEDVCIHWQHWVCRSSIAMSGLYECLDSLVEMGIRLCLVTNGKSKVQRATVKALQLEQYFEHILISEEVGVKKPAPTIFLAALRKMDCIATQSIFIGDHPINDYLASEKLGFKALWLKGSHVWPTDQEPPQRVIRSLSEIHPIIKKLTSA